MSGTPLPAAMELRDLLSGMLGRDVEIAVGGDPVTAATRPVVGVYVTELGDANALVAVDLTLAARLGAAIALIPPGGADAAIEDGVLPEALLENTSEVLNVTASLFNADGAPHLKLDGVHDAARHLLPEALTSWLRSYGPRLDVTVTIKGYGAGQLSVLVD